MDEIIVLAIGSHPLRKQVCISIFLQEYDESPYYILPDLIPAENSMFRSKDQFSPLNFALKTTFVEWIIGFANGQII